MKRDLRWYEFITVNIYWLGLNIGFRHHHADSAALPGAALYAAGAEEHLLCDDPRHRAGGGDAGAAARGDVERPQHLPLGQTATLHRGGGALQRALPHHRRSVPVVCRRGVGWLLRQTFGVTTAYAVLLVGIVVLQVSSNVAHGALQGLIPDLVPEHQRGRASGVKAVFELIPVFLVLFIGPLVDAGKVGLVVGIIMRRIRDLDADDGALRPRGAVARETCRRRSARPALRLVFLTAIFVTVTRFATWLVTPAVTS